MSAVRLSATGRNCLRTAIRFQYCSPILVVVRRGKMYVSKKCPHKAYLVRWRHETTLQGEAV
ncbi:hypothetical protein [Azospirillum argentinense]